MASNSVDRLEIVSLMTPKSHFVLTWPIGEPMPAMPSEICISSAVLFALHCYFQLLCTLTLAAYATEKSALLVSHCQSLHCHRWMVIYCLLSHVF